MSQCCSENHFNISFYNFMIHLLTSNLILVRLFILNSLF